MYLLQILIKKFLFINLTIFIFISCQKNYVKDIDGNKYKIIKIGDQIWMAENLRVTRYNNGDPIPEVTDNQEWSNLKTGAYCNYNNNDSLGNIYGRLYNWYAIIDSRGIAPKGWRIPTTEDLMKLISYLGGDSVTGGKLKERGTTHWLWPNKGATNESKFNALPGGYRLNFGGTFHSLGSNAYYWTTTESFELYSWSQQIFYAFADKSPEMEFATYGFSVRCIKDK